MEWRILLYFDVRMKRRSRIEVDDVEFGYDTGI